MCYLCCGLLVLLSRGFCSCNECNLAKSAYLAARKWLNRSVWCRTLFNISTNYSKSILARLNIKRGIITSVCDRLVFKCSVVDSWEKVTDIGRLVKRDCELHRRQLACLVFPSEIFLVWSVRLLKQIILLRKSYINRASTSDAFY